MSISNTLRFITNHPLNRGRKAGALLDFLKWQVGARLVPGPVVFPWVNGAKVVVRPGEKGLTGNVYCGLDEFADMAYLLHVVGAEDLFVDVGANVGSYTVLACGAKGARGYCFEPVPSTYERLSENIRVNGLGSRVRHLNLGLSSGEGALRFTSGNNCTNHVLAEGETSDEVVEVRVRSLDDVLRGENPSVMKIDVEGFESQVLAGAGETLRNPSLHSVIMELNGSGNRYGVDEADLLKAMQDFGFSTYTYDPFARALLPLSGKNNHAGNTLFIRDAERVRALVAAAPAFTVKGVRV